MAALMATPFMIDAGLPFLAAASKAMPLIMSVGGMIASAGAQRQQGQAQKQEADYVAAQERAQAGQQMAAAERSQVNEERKTAYVLSNERAAAAAGGGASDPTVVTNEEAIAGEGKYRAQTALFEGQSQAYALNNKASLSEYQGTLDAQAGRTRAMSTIVSGASSLFQKYGGFGGGYNPASGAGYG